MSHPVRSHRPTHVQCLHELSQNTAIPFDQRFMFYPMSWSEEPGAQTRIDYCLCVLYDVGRMAEVMVHGLPVSAIYDPLQFSSTGELERYLNQLYRGQYQLADDLRFSQEARRLEPKQRHYSAWLDLTNNVFWTWDFIQLQDVRHNLAQSKERFLAQDAD